MRVLVEMYFPFRSEIGGGPVELELPEGGDVAAALAALVARHPVLRERLYDRQGQVHRHIAALVNGTAVQYRQGLATPLRDGDVLTLLPPVGGG